MKTIFVPFLILIALITLSFCIEGADIIDYTFPESQGTTENFFLFHGQKCGEVTAGEYIRREGQYINAYARSAVHMWASGLNGADGTIANIVEYRADGKVKGTGNTTFISDGTPPMTDQYTDPSRNGIVHSSDFVAYGGGTRTNVAYIKQAGLGNRERSLFITGTGRAQRYIGWSDTPAKAPWYLDPWAWAQGRVLNQSENPQPKKVNSESNARGNTNGNNIVEDPISISSSVSPSASLSSSSSWVSPYQSVSFTLTTTTAFGSVSWYVKRRGESGLGSIVKTENGSYNSYSGSLSYSFSSSGDYVITAYITDYSDSSTYEASAAVHVPPPQPTPTDNTPNCPDCTSDCSYPCSCSNSGTCGGARTDNTPDCSSCTDGCSSCDTSDDSGYTAPSPPPTPPPTPTVSCRRSACTGSVSSSDEHRVDPCSACGRSYWSCGPSAAWSESQHRFRTCRRSGCGQSWRLCQGEKPDCLVWDGKCWAR